MEIENDSSVEAIPNGGAAGSAPILVVDDNPANVALFETVLKQLGQPIIGVLSGREAIAAVERQSFAVILLDVQMPGMDGFEVAEALRSHVQKCGTAVIFVTAIHSQSTRVKQGYALGAIGYLFKPVDINILRAKVAIFVDLFLQRQALTKALERAVHAECLLSLQAAELKRSNEDLERFAYIASHDLKEPLRMVTSYVQLLARRYGGQLDEKADQFIGFATEGAVRMGALIDDLLLYSRVGTRGGTSVECDADASLARALHDLGPALLENGATVTHEPLPRVVVDQSQFEQVLRNLIANAIKVQGRRATARTHRCNAACGTA